MSKKYYRLIMYVPDDKLKELVEFVNKNDCVVSEYKETDEVKYERVKEFFTSDWDKLVELAK